jgi:glycosyltransferase involved in cell wall biosynthesis
MPSRTKDYRRFVLRALETALGILCQDVNRQAEPRANFEELVEGTTRLITNRDLRLDLGKRGRQYVADHHSLDYLQKRLIGIYGKLLEN